MRTIALALLVAAHAVAAGAQDFTKAAEVKPILGLQKDRWLAVREYDGQDLIYFTALLSWRCGLDEIRYGLNGAPADVVLGMEPCHENTASPNALTGDGGAIYVVAPLGSVQTIRVVVTYDDGSEETVDYARAAILMP